MGAQLARYGNVQPSEYYAMTPGEAEAWAEALMDLVHREREEAINSAFMKGDFDNRF